MAVTAGLLLGRTLGGNAHCCQFLISFHMVVVGVAVLGKDVRAAPPLCTPHMLPRPLPLAEPSAARRQRPALPPACAAGQKLCRAILPSLSKLGSRARAEQPALHQGIRPA